MEKGKKGFEIAVPGEILAVIEEFLPGENVIEENGFLKSTRIGLIIKNFEKHELKVSPLKKRVIPKTNDIVYAQVSSISKDDITAFTKIYYVKDLGYLPHTFTGVLHVANVSPGYIKSIYEAVRPGDIIRARVVGITGPPFHLSIKERENGVVYAFCNYCLTPLSKGSTGGLYCPRCRVSIRRKVSSFYGRV